MLSIGVLILPPVQLMDLSPIELFSMMSKDYIRANNLPQTLIDAAIPAKDIKIHYISSIGPNSTAGTIPNLQISITAAIDDPKVAPGKLDILFIPGTDPNQRPEEAVLEYVRSQEQSGATILAFCTGVFVLAYSGVLDNKDATGPRSMLDHMRTSFPKVRWQEKRYMNNDKIWTSGQITNGVDMAAEYISQQWPGQLSTAVINLADIVIRPAEYSCLI
ncbi:DJ-1/PfpI family protein [Aaosphaeria arxii CBS 175.79]|uniref:DJ-1/PfpI family protein n=1 Tax=Aaosphaeria arxii CBS 175.79 TaxID=1450172 RepID=A0A6A5XGP0_9PLEO|nr:DJ-1/PfpI family protein [Aaosphaeria arxii CBS 175.79]KAF2012405.1 DJ-1/PfpI family protein [Aaosphaeria arxii CBS 175.79]